MSLIFFFRFSQAFSVVTVRFCTADYEDSTQYKTYQPYVARSQAALFLLCVCSTRPLTSLSVRPFFPLSPTQWNLYWKHSSVYVQDNPEPFCKVHKK